MRHPRRRGFSFVVVILVLGTGLLQYCIGTLHSSAASNPETIGMTSASPSLTDLIEMKEQIYNTLVSCLGSHCIDQRHPESPKDRVYFTSLPGSGSDLYEILLKLVPAETVELVRSSRSLPYGYGKNHGYNRVIKFVANPFEYLQENSAASLGQNSASSREKLASSHKSLSPSLKLMMRWNCRQKVLHTKSLVSPSVLNPKNLTLNILLSL